MLARWWLQLQLCIDRMLEAAVVSWQWLCTREGEIHVVIFSLTAVLVYLSFRFLPPHIYIAGGNGLWIGMILLIAWLCIRTLRMHWRTMTWEMKALCIGGLCGSLGVIARQFFWSLNIWTRESGSMYAAWALKWRFLPSLFVLFICAGGMIATRAFGESLYGVRGWWTRVILVLFISTFGSALLAL